MTKDPVIYKDEIYSLAQSVSTSSGEDHFFPVVLLIPVRLGLENVTQCYYHQIKNFFTLPYSLGIIGGLPKSSLYFIGFQGNNLVYLDPHYVQPADLSKKQITIEVFIYLNFLGLNNFLIFDS